MSKDWNEFKEYVRSRGVMAKELFVVHSEPIVDAEEMGALMGEHLAYQKKLEAEGKLFAAGPLGDEDGAVWSREGLIILCAESLEEARALAEGDPMHAQGKKRPAEYILSSPVLSCLRSLCALEAQVFQVLGDPIAYFAKNAGNLRGRAAC